ncbi:hypothetical protein [Pyxidicoccus trucidator]|uniref:hypothetical protein n=1 Tax=Pyxidicoccus trucidator TaxID=2709662 RepID=UPI001F0852E3|nr:hypothetical protein [Pyxidicoccus trucidator]
MLLALRSTLGAGLAARVLTCVLLTLLSTFGAGLVALLLAFGPVLATVVVLTLR